MQVDKKLSREWVFTFVGTGIGAGLLFLPIQAGKAGFLMSLLTMAIAFPLTYFGHKYLLAIILKSQNKESLDKVFENYYSPKTGKILSVLFILIVFSIILAYSIGLSNTIDDALLKNSGRGVILLAQALLFVVLTSLMLFKEKLLLSILEKMTWILLALLIITAIIFIPFWNLSAMFYLPSSKLAMLKSFLLLFPLFAFSLEIFPAISPMVSSLYRQNAQCDEEAIEKSSYKITKRAFLILGTFIGLFTLSSIFALTPANLSYAAHHNLSALAVLKIGNNPKLQEITSGLGKCIAILALLTSYYGTMFGLRDAVVSKMGRLTKLSLRKKRQVSVIALNTIIFICVIGNFSVIGILSAITAPGMGLLIFIVPVIAMKRYKALFKNFSKLGKLCVFSAGILLIIAFIVGILIKGA